MDCIIELLQILGGLRTRFPTHSVIVECGALARYQKSAPPHSSVELYAIAKSRASMVTTEASRRAIAGSSRPEMGGRDNPMPTAAATVGHSMPGRGRWSGEAMAKGISSHVLNLDATLGQVDW